MDFSASQEKPDGQASKSVPKVKKEHHLDCAAFIEALSRQNACKDNRSAPRHQKSRRIRGELCKGEDALSCIAKLIENCGQLTKAKGDTKNLVWLINTIIGMKESIYDELFSVRIFANIDTSFGKYSDRPFRLNPDIFSGAEATLWQILKQVSGLRSLFNAGNPDQELFFGAKATALLVQDSLRRGRMGRPKMG